jgi:hypothetical protein
VRGCTLTERDLTSDGDKVLPLHELIRARMDDRGWTYGQLEHRSDGQLTKGRWQQLGTQTRVSRSPEPDTIRVLARVLEIDETTIWLSVGESLGLDVTRRGPMLAQLLPAGTDQLSDRMRDAILAIIRAAVAESWERGADEPGTPGVAADVTLEWSKTDEATRRSTGG